MRCGYCREAVGWWRRRCNDCRALYAIVATHRGADMETIMQRFIESGVARDKVEKFLNADPRGEGAIRDQIAADMTNQLLEALGQRGRQTAGDVRRIRARGNWVNLDQRPRE